MTTPNRLAAPSSTTAVVVGGGIMGADVAQVLTRAGATVYIVEPDKTRHASLQAPAVQSLDDITWPSVSLVIECIPENLALKQQLFQALEQKASPATVLASNSSSFPISQIASGLATASRMYGLHFFMPANVVPLVEVILGDASDVQRADELSAFMQRCGCVPILVKKDIPGFIANRLQHALAREAYALIDAGVATPEDIDAAVRFGFGFRYLAAGPVLQKEHAGWDVHLTAAQTIYPSLSNATTPPPSMMEKLDKGDIGMKSGQGFYTWDTAAIAQEKQRYHRVLQAALTALSDELPPIEK